MRPLGGAAAIGASGGTDPVQRAGIEHTGSWIEPDELRAVVALARTWRRQKQLDKGVYSAVTAIAEAEKISKRYVSRILRLALLAPDVVKAILAGWADQRVMLEKLERPLPAGWEGQRWHLVLSRQPIGLQSQQRGPIGAVSSHPERVFGLSR